MRELVDATRLERLLRALGAAAAEDGACYLVGGATAVLEGWRATTVDVDVKLVPEQDSVLRAIPAIKNELRLNVETAWPGDFIPLPSGWESRSPTVAKHGRLAFAHLDFYSQALAKLERAHERDLEDVRAMLDRGLVERQRLFELFEEIEPALYRFPAVDPRSFRLRVERMG
ncbi:MAG TPA: DUF6036 family nucleotidyltransferase [Gaiellaceae bacterium]